MSGSGLSGVKLANNRISNNAFLLDQNPILGQMFLDFTNNGKLLEAPAVSVPVKFSQGKALVSEKDSLI